MKDTLIEVSHLSKKFSKNLNYLMKYSLIDISKNILGLNTHSDKLRKGEFWAVDDVSFKLKRGETLGIIGPNGAGKTTILKMLNGILIPDKGGIKIKGKVGALIQVGAGFHPLLTGRENIYVNGAILGMSKKEIDKKFDEIVDFADIGDFLDAPVKTYSSGMFVRLGFSVAVHSDPDILLVDEILAVGDYNFQRKCLEKMREKAREGTSFVLVSHAMGNILSGTSKSLLLTNGKMVTKGESRKVIKRYIDELNISAASEKKQLMTQFRRGSGEVRIINVFIADKKGNKINEIPTGKQIRIKCLFRTYKPIKNPVFFFMIRDVITRQVVLFASSENQKQIRKLGKSGEFEFIFEKQSLGSRAYYLCGGIIANRNYNAPVDMWDDAGERFIVKEKGRKEISEIALLHDSLIISPYSFKIKLGKNN